MYLALKPDAQHQHRATWHGLGEHLPGAPVIGPAQMHLQAWPGVEGGAPSPATEQHCEAHVGSEPRPIHRVSRRLSLNDIGPSSKSVMMLASSAHEASGRVTLRRAPKPA